MSWIRSKPHEIGISKSAEEHFLEKSDLHLHFPAGAIPKDGPSAGVTITTALAGRAAMRAGLSSGDVIVAVDGLRVDERSLKALLARRKAGDRVKVHAFRRDELLQVDVRLAAGDATECTLSLDEHAADAIRRQRNHWLGQHA